MRIKILFAAALLVLIAGGGGIAWLSTRPPAERWASTAAMANGRSSHTATRLPSGKVIVTGGWGSGNTVETFDPSTLQWSPGKTMPTLRYLHSATLLANGKVLITGGMGREGSGGDNELALVDLYDPQSDSWVRAGRMATARMLNTATLLQDGRVLVLGGAGGSRSRGVLKTAEIFDPLANNWSPAAPMAAPASLSRHTATLLASGLVLVAGGYDMAAMTVASATLASAELFNPETNTWAVAAPMSTAREFHTATLLVDGRVLVVGGQAFSNKSVPQSAFFPTTEIFDPTNNTWTPGPPMSVGRSGHTATLLSSGRVLVVGGGVNTSETFDPAIGKWSQPLPLAVKPAERTNHTATLLATGDVLIAGGVGTEKRAVYAEMVGQEMQNVPDATSELWHGSEKPGPASTPFDVFYNRLSASCEGGKAQACASLAALTARGPAPTTELPKILALLERACAGGIVSSCKEGAAMYKNGEGAAPNAGKAVDLLKLACDAQDPPACTLVAIALQRGEGVPQDLSEAARLFAVACSGANGTGVACVLLALAYENGAGVTKDLNAALAIYEKGCAARDQEICGALGGFLMEAPQPVGDKPRGRSLSEQACKLGNQAACQWLRQAGDAEVAFDLRSGTFAATTAEWKAARDAVLTWCGANTGKCAVDAVELLKAPADGALTVGSGDDATLTTCSPGNCPTVAVASFKRAGTTWSVTKVEAAVMGD